MELDTHESMIISVARLTRFSSASSNLNEVFLEIHRLVGKPRYLSSPSPRLSLYFTESPPPPEYEGLYAVRTQLAFPRSSRFDTELLSVFSKVWASPYRYHAFEVGMLFALARLSCFLCAEGTSASTLPTSGTSYGCTKFFGDHPFSYSSVPSLPESRQQIVIQPRNSCRDYPQIPCLLPITQ